MIFLVEQKIQKNLREFMQEALDNGALDSSTIAQELEQMIPELMGGSKFFNATKSGKFETVIQGTTSDNVMASLLTGKGPIGKVVGKVYGSLSVR